MVEVVKRYIALKLTECYYNQNGFCTEEYINQFVSSNAGYNLHVSGRCYACYINDGYTTVDYGCAYFCIKL